MVVWLESLCCLQWQSFVIIRLLEDLWIGIRPPFVVSYPGPGATFVVDCPLLPVSIFESQRWDMMALT